MGWALRTIRLLLLARNDGDWWQSLRQHDTALAQWLDATPPYELPTLADTEAQRRAVFEEAAVAFAAVRRRACPDGVSRSFADARVGRALYLHMAALAAADGLPFEASTVMTTVLDHEERFWDAAPQALDDPGLWPVLEQAARELLLAQSSDWQFIISTGAAGDYATKRFVEHCEALARLLAALEDPGHDRQAALTLAAELALIDGPFPDLIGAIAAASDVVDP